MIKCTTACLAALALLGLLCDAQVHYGKPRIPPQVPRDPSQRPRNDQSKQTFDIFTWTYPPQEVEPTSPQVDVELKQPDPSATVSATCGETSAQVVVMKDLFNNGQIISASDMKLGGCSHVREDAAALVFETLLHECDSAAQVSTVK